MLQLNDSDLSLVKKYLTQYKAAQTATFVPWEMVAAVHYREAGLGLHPSAPGGPFQFDPPPHEAQCEFLLHKYSNLDPNNILINASRGVGEFQAGAILAACWLKHQCKFPLGLHPAISVVQDAFLGYNGRVFASAERDPYVMNGYDDSHMNMHLKGTLPDGHGGRKFVDIIDHRPGAFTVYAQLVSLNL